MDLLAHRNRIESDLEGLHVDIAADGTPLDPTRDIEPEYERLSTICSLLLALSCTMPMPSAFTYCLWQTLQLDRRFEQFTLSCVADPTASGGCLGPVVFWPPPLLERLGPIVSPEI